MKKIIGAAAAGLVLTGAAFADVSISAQARVYSDVFSYESPSRNTQNKDTDNSAGVDDIGAVIWAKDTKHADDITLNASTENAGAKIVFNVESNYYDNTDSSTNKSVPNQNINTSSENKVDVGLTSYQLWAKFGKIRVDAGAYDQRLGKNVNNDGNWGNNYSASNKAGIWVGFDYNLVDKDGKTLVWGKDAGNITTIQGNKTVTNFQVSTPLTDQLTLRGVLFLSKSGTLANGGNDANSMKTTSAHTDSNPWIFTPFGLGATYAIDKNSQLNVVGKLNYIAQGDSNKPQVSVWTLHANYYKKSDNLEIEAGYTLGASVYTNNGKHGAHYDFLNKRESKHLVRDNDVFAHGFDFRVKDKLSSQLSVTGIVGVNYVQSSEVLRSLNRNTRDTKITDVAKGGTTSNVAYKDARARSYGTGAAGIFAYYATASVDYAASDTITYQVQAKLADNNLFGVATGDSSKYHVDYLEGMTLNIRPGILLNVDKSQFFAGFDFGIKGFQTSASGKNNTVQTTYAIPIGLRFRM